MNGITTRTRVVRVESLIYSVREERYFIEIRRKESVNTCLVLFAIARANPIDFGQIRGKSDPCNEQRREKGN